MDNEQTTRDGETVIHADTRYWWFDRLYLRLESASWMPCQINYKDRVANVQGSKIPFAWLRQYPSTALQDGVDFYRQRIAADEMAILKLGSEYETWQLSSQSSVK